MKTPTLEEVKKHFENAKVIICLSDNQEVDITKYPIIKGVYFDFDCEGSWIDLGGSYDNSVKLWTESYGYAHIIEDKTTEGHECPSVKITDSLLTDFEAAERIREGFHRFDKYLSGGRLGYYKPTIQEVREHFKDATRIKSLFEEEQGNPLIDYFREHTFEYLRNSYWVSALHLNKRIKVWSLKDGYAEIVEHKDDPEPDQEPKYILSLKIRKGLKVTYEGNDLDELYESIKHIIS